MTVLIDSEYEIPVPLVLQSPIITSVARLAKRRALTVSVMFVLNLTIIAVASESPGLADGMDLAN